MSRMKTDGQLLEAFVNGQNHAAFAELVRRHEKMVFNVCVRQLGNSHGAEDASQAVFLTLSQKAKSLTGHPSLAGWLHRVALFIAKNAQRSERRQQMHRQSAARETTAEAELELWNETRDVLDEQIQKLPSRIRQSMILFYFEQLSISQIAERLSASEGTVSAWLSRGRNKLRTLLSKHGIVLSGMVLVGLLSNESCQAAPPAEFSSRVVQATQSFGTGEQSLGVISPQCLEMTQGALHMLAATKTTSTSMTIAAIVLTTGAVTAAAISPGISGWQLAANSIGQVGNAATSSGQQTTIDLLKAIDPKRDSIVGNWKLAAGELTIEATPKAHLSIPVEPQGAYELQVEFTRHDGDDGVDFVLPVGGKQCALELSGWNGAAHGIVRIDGRNCKDDQNPTSVKPGTLENGKKQKLTINVTPQDDSVAIAVNLNGQAIIDWTGKKDRLQPHFVIKSPSNNVLGLAAFGVGVTYHKITLKSPVAPTISKTSPAKKTTKTSSTGPSNGATTVVGKTLSFEGKAWNIGRAQKATIETYKGKKALHVVGQETAYVWIPGTDFSDGTIEVDIASGTFSGIGFRGKSDGSRVQKLYFRPFNSGTAKHDRTVQYSMLGRSDAHWSELRKNFPGKFESGADIAVNKWFHVRIVVAGEKLTAYVDDAKQPVLVVDKMFDGKTTGTVGVWGWDSYFANFKFTPAK